MLPVGIPFINSRQSPCINCGHRQFTSKISLLSPASIVGTKKPPQHFHSGGFIFFDIIIIARIKSKMLCDLVTNYAIYSQTMRFYAIFCALIIVIGDRAFHIIKIRAVSGLANGANHFILDCEFCVLGTRYGLQISHLRLK